MNKQILRNTVFIGLFLVPFIPFLVSSQLFFPFITTKAFAWRIIVEIVFSAWLLLAFLDVEYRPKKSPILYAVAAFLLIIGFADLFGVAPFKSFWSNFERMEGFITLLHLGMFFVVTSSAFKEIDWKRWWNVSLVASFLMVLYCVLQIIGLKTINQGGVRVDGTLGNAIYLAVYMLFHIFIALLFLWREWKNVALRWVYGLLILTQAFILYYTATRGAILGLIGGLFVVAVLNIRNRESAFVRKTSIALLCSLVLLIGGFFLIKDTAFVRNSPVLSRFSSLNTEELKTQGRYFVWPMAFDGFKERPLLGWGQENFSYVFQGRYNPEMFRLEPWFDRVHNIFLDWMIAGGIFGLLAYLFLYVALLYIVWWRDQDLTYIEKSILTGLVAAYFFHNFFVFDHLTSYILFFSLLAYLHSRSAVVPLWTKDITGTKVRIIVTLLISILLASSLYFVNIRPLLGNAFLIEALKSTQSGEFEKAWQSFRRSYQVALLGRLEVSQYLASNSIAILESELSLEKKNEFYAFAKETVLKEADSSPDDARTQLVAGSFLINTGFPDEALKYLERARTLAPGKQQVYFDLGSAYFGTNEPDKGLELFKSAYDLAPEYIEAKLIYLIGAIYAGNREVENEILSKLTEGELVLLDDRIINAYYANGRIDRVKSLLESRIRLNPANADKYRQYLETIEK